MERSSRLAFCVLGALFLAAGRPATAQITIVGPTNHVASLIIPPDNDTIALDPDPIVHISGSSAVLHDTLTSAFPDWSFAFSDLGLQGTLTVNRYEATTAGPHNGGGLIDATYSRDPNDPTIADLHWIQMVSTNRPLGGATSPYIDPRPNDDTLPFYWTLAEDAQAGNGAKTATTYHFFDNSQRTLNLPHPDSITWRGDLLLASWDNNTPGSVTVYDGIEWGWDLNGVGQPAAPEPGSAALLLAAAGGSGAGLAARRRTRPAAPGPRGRAVR